MEKYNFRNQFYTTYGWMCQDLELKGSMLQLYALIYSYDSKGKKFTASLDYISEWTGLSKKQVIDNLKRLCSEKYLYKYKNGNHGCMYTINYELLQKVNIEVTKGKCDSYESTMDKVTKGKCESYETTPNNITDTTNNNIVDNRENIPPIPNQQILDEIIYCETEDVDYDFSDTQLKEDSVPRFEEMWQAYGRYGSKEKALTEWNKLKGNAKIKVRDNMQNYLDSIDDLKYKKYFENYLRDGNYNIEYNPSKKRKGSPLSDEEIYEIIKKSYSSNNLDILPF